MNKKYITNIIKYKKILLYFIFFLTLISIYFVKDLKIDPSTSKLMILNDPTKHAYQEATKTFGMDNDIIVVIKDKNLFTYKKLAVVSKIIKKIEQLHGVVKVDSLFNQRNFITKKNILYNDYFLKLDDIPKKQSELENIKKDAINNPLINKNFIGKDGKQFFLHVKLINNDSSEFFKKLTSEIDTIIKTNQNDFEQIFQIGLPYIEASILDDILSSLKTTVPLTFLILFFVLKLYLKDIRLALIPMATAFISIVITFAFMVLMNYPITLVTSLVPILIILIGSTEDSHIITEYLLNIKKFNNKILLLNLISNKIRLAIFLTFTTTIIGFASIYFNQVIALKEFAIITSFGLFVNFIVTILLVPLILLYFSKSKQKTNDFKYINKILDKFYFFVKKSSYNVIILCIIFIGFVFTLLFNFKVDNNLLNYFKKDSIVSIRNNYISHNMYGSQIFYITVKINSKNAFKKYKNLKILSEIKQIILNKTKFNYAISLADYISSINKAFHDNDPKYNILPKNNNLIAQYLILLYRNDISNYINTNFDYANIIVFHNIFSSYEFNQEKRKLEILLQKKFHNKNIKIDIVGRNILLNNAADTISKGQFISLIVTLILIFLLLSVILKHIKYGLIALIANLFPIMSMFFLMYILNIPLNLITAMVATITFGVIVDDTIHIIMHYQYLKRQYKSDIVKSIIYDEGKAVLLTSVMIILGYTALFFSTFVPVIQFAYLSIFTVFVALVSDLYITPLLLLTFDKKYSIIR